jgi:hypothetical protein
MTIDEQSRCHAISRLSHKRAYRHQVINYLWVNALLIVVWALSGFGFFWPIYSLLGWGAALLIQGWKILTLIVTRSVKRRSIERSRESEINWCWVRVS